MWECVSDKYFSKGDGEGEWDGQPTQGQSKVFKCEIVDFSFDNDKAQRRFVEALCWCVYTC